MNGRRILVHVIMPVGADKLAGDKRVIILRAAERIGVAVSIPAYDFRAPDAALGKALDDIERAECILADLTYERPSCYYELGFAEAHGKPIAIVAALGTAIHQTTARSTLRVYRDLGDYGLIVEDALH